MKKLDLWSGLFWMVVGVLISLQAFRLGLGTLRAPGPGFLFFWGGIALAALASSILISALRSLLTKRSEGDSKAFENVHWRKVVCVLVSLIAYGALFEKLGYLIATFLLIGFLLQTIETKKWYFGILIAFLSSTLSYLLFDVWLQVRLPAGLFGI
jgi:putative tricarboxylic transport membrane protein